MAPTKPQPRVLPDSDWDNRTYSTTFRSLMHLDPHPSNPDTYYSTSAGFPPTPSPRTYGGHVFAQSAWAAAHTVPHGQHVHSITGYFLLLGDTRYAFEYRVRRIRDGGVYALRMVEAYQDSAAAGHGKTPTFVAIISFKRDERGKHRKGVKGQRSDFGHQDVGTNWLEREYGEVLKRRKFDGWPVAQGMDGMWTQEMNLEMWKRRGDAFPGLDMRKVDMAGYNPEQVVRGGLEDEGATARRWRLILLYKLVADAEEEKKAARSAAGLGKKKTGAEDLINLHACAHLYASDRNSLFLAYRALGFERYTGHTGSLSHTVNFHGYSSDFVMLDKDGNAKEFAQESWISNSGADRVTHNSRMFDRTSGKIIASTVQDGMMRIPMQPNPVIIDGDSSLRREAKL